MRSKYTPLLLLFLLSCDIENPQQPKVADSNIETPSKNLKLSATAGIRIGYLWLNEAILRTNILPETSVNNNNNKYYSNLTHVIISFANPMDNNASTVTFTNDNGNKLLEPFEIEQLIRGLRLKNPKIRIGVALAGAGVKDGTTLYFRYKRILKNLEKRKALIKSIHSFCKTYNIDFVDVDLEYQTLAFTGYNEFVQSLYDEGKKLNINTTLTLEYKYPKGINYKGGNTKHLLDNIVHNATLQKCDLLNIMSYDYNASWDSELPGGIKYKNHSPYAVAERDVNYFIINRSVPASKIILGIPFYGKRAYSQDPLKEVWELENPLTETQGVGEETYYFSGSAILYRKIEMAKQKNIGGFMFWSIYSDFMNEYDKSVLKYIVDKQK